MLCGGLGVLVFQRDGSSREEGAEAGAVLCPAEHTHTQISIAHSGGWQTFPVVR